MSGATFHTPARRAAPPRPALPTLANSVSVRDLDFDFWIAGKRSEQSPLTWLEACALAVASSVQKPSVYAGSGMSGNTMATAIVGLCGALTTQGDSYEVD
jgi:hypothetical protein